MPISRRAAINASTNAITPNSVAVANNSVETPNRNSRSSVSNTVNTRAPRVPSIRRITRYTANGTGKIMTRLR